MLWTSAGNCLRGMGSSSPLFLALCCILLVPFEVNGAANSTSHVTAQGFEAELPASEADVLESVKEVSRDHVIHGTYVYEREKTLTGAHELDSSSAFGSWGENGQLVYKAADDVVDPRHFKGSNGLGAITVRYIVQKVSAEKTKLRIDAIFTVAGRHRPGLSDGTVESAEFDAIRSRLEVVQQSRLAAPSEVARREEVHAPVKASPSTLKPPPIVSPPPTETQDSDALRELEQRVAKLRTQVEVQVKSDGTALRSAPFARAAAIQFLPATTKLVVLVLTPKWYGVESQDGHRGWIRRSELGAQP